jgi:ribosomal protein S18 acetylase RimI-like enzyme
MDSNDYISINGQSKQLTFITITNKNIELLENFIVLDTSDSFRYFDKRDSSVITNHKLTIIAILDKNIVGYGHLDFDKYLWLGICVIKKYQGYGIGQKIMDYIITFADRNNNKLYLTVDKNNIIAKKIYDKYGFIVDTEESTYYKMVRNSVIKK